MILSDNDITSFQSLYKDLIGKEISREDAHLKGSQILMLMSLIRRPIKNNEECTKKVL